MTREQADWDLISRNNAITSVCQWGTTLERTGTYTITVAEMKQTITDMLCEMPPVAIPSAEPKTGHWVAIDEEPHEDYECDKCGYICSTWTSYIKPSEEYKFCPYCGTRMVEPQESEGKE